MADEIKRIDIKEFRSLGFLQEANRQFFHPLGLALEVNIGEDGAETLGGVWDYRDDFEGILFGGKALPNKEKAENVKRIYDEKAKERIGRYGYVVQPVE
jgi:hypothetical protein